VPGVKTPSVVFLNNVPFILSVLARFDPLLRSRTATGFELAAFPIVMFPPTSRIPDALVNRILAILSDVVPPFITTLFVTLRVKAPMESWIVPLPVGALIVRLLHVADTSRVIVNGLPLILNTTSSVELGTACFPYATPFLTPILLAVSVRAVLFVMLNTVPIALPSVCRMVSPTASSVVNNVLVPVTAVELLLTVTVPVKVLIQVEAVFQFPLPRGITFPAHAPAEKNVRARKRIVEIRFIKASVEQPLSKRERCSFWYDQDWAKLIGDLIVILAPFSRLMLKTYSLQHGLSPSEHKVNSRFRNC
jgi:hypothetical protein